MWVLEFYDVWYVIKFICSVDYILNFLDSVFDLNEFYDDMLIKLEKYMCIK